MRRTLAIAALMLSVSIAPTFAQSQSDSSVPTIPETQIEPRKVATPYEFISAASSADEFEIKSSTLAKTLASSAEVKAFADMLISDHTAAMAELIAAGKADKVEIAAPSPDGEQQGLLAKLENVKGEDFDKMFIQAQLFVHQRAIALFKGYAGETSNLGKYANKTLPTLTGHYAMATKLADSLGMVDEAQ